MSRVRILVVDDEPQIRRFLKTTLEVHGYDVALAEDGRAALEQITAWRPDLILLAGCAHGRMCQLLCCPSVIAKPTR